MCKPSPPPPPDYAAAANAQGQANRETAMTSSFLSNPNFIGPGGSQTVTYDPVRTQHNFDADRYIAATPGLEGQSADAAWQHYQQNGGQGYWGDEYQPTVNQTLSPEAQQIYDRLTGMAVGGLDRVGNAMSQPFNTSQAATTGRYGELGVGRVNQDQPYAYGYDSGGDIQRDIDYNRDIQYSFGDAGEIKKNLGIDDFSKDRYRVEEALMSRMNPQLERDRAALETRLANQGITLGSEAYNQGVDEYARQANDARMQAILAGGGEQSRLFGLNLASGQFENAAQQQLYNQLLGRGMFYNQAQNQGFGQAATSMQLHNQAQAQGNDQARLAAGFRNATIGQQVNSDLARGNFENQARTQLIQEALLNRQQPLQELNALRTGSQMQVPQFQQWTGQNVAPPPIFGATQNQYQAGLNNYNASTGNANSQLQTLGTLAGAAAMFFSDRRLKSNVVKVGTHPLGIGIYEYDIFGHRETGVMADEVLKVKPEAVVRHQSGYLMVNYDMIGGRL